jgi:hypothetical protein
VKIRAIRLWNVRRFANRGVAIEAIEDGVNVLAAENEQGKSTSFDALHALLFQPHTATQKAVRLLRPHSGGSPRIEADIETDQGLHRVTKQYYAGRAATVTELATGRLVAQADQAEAWIADLTRGGASGPTGLLWVRQGITDFETGGKAQQDQETEARKDALASVAGEEVEALTGGRRMAWILQRCQDDLDVLVTERGQARKGGPYAEAIEELEQLRADEANQAEMLSSLREALDQRRSKQARRDEIMAPDAIKERRDEMARAAEALERATSHASQLAEAVRLRDIEVWRHGLARESLARHREALERSQTTTARLADAERIHGEAVTDVAASQKQEEEATRGLGEVEAAHARAREDHRRAVSAGHGAEARKQLTVLEGRLEKARESQSQIEALVAREQALALPDDAVARLGAMEAEISDIGARLDAKSALVTVRYAENPTAAIQVDGAPLAEGDSRAVTRSTRFEIPDIGVLTVSAGADTDDGLVEALQSKQSAFTRDLEQLGVEDIAALRERERTLSEVRAGIRVARAELAAWAPDGLEALRIEAARIADLTADIDPDAPDLDQATRAVEQAAAAANAARIVAETARAALSGKREAASLAKLTIDHLRETLTDIDRILGPEAERHAEGDRLATAEAEAAAALTVATQKVTDLHANAPDLETAQAAAKRAASVVNNLDGEAARLDQEISGLTGEIRARSEDAIEEVLAETRDKRQAAEERVAALEAEIAVLRRLRGALDEARLAAKEQYLGPVMEELRPLISLVVSDASITFDDETLVPRSLERNGQEEDVSVLSGGMREQLTVLTRLAFARLLAKNGKPVPVILDDALVYSDDDRIEKMFDALHRQASDLQIIVFSCRQRAFERLGGQSLRMVDWTLEEKSG